MYRSYYQLKSKPFQISSDPSFLWLGEKHKEALAVLKYGILDNRGFLLLTGDVGTGKTTLINALKKTLDNRVLIATVPDPGLDRLDFYNYISSCFGLGRSFTGKGEFLTYFNKFLLKVHDKNYKVLLIIDEAQRLSHELLEEIRLLSNLEKETEKLINIFFVGQDEFNDILLKDENRALRQRLTINYHLKPLTALETENYIVYRLKVAGTDRRIFSPGAVHKIHEFSNGYPRLVNIICDHALLTGYVKELSTITERTVEECAGELRIRSREEAGLAVSSNESGQEIPDYIIHTASYGENKSAVVKNIVFSVVCVLIIAAVIQFFFSADESLFRHADDTYESPEVIKYHYSEDSAAGFPGAPAGAVDSPGKESAGSADYPDKYGVSGEKDDAAYHN